jgi:hypothetical protein
MNNPYDPNIQKIQNLDDKELKRLAFELNLLSIDKAKVPQLDPQEREDLKRDVYNYITQLETNSNFINEIKQKNEASRSCANKNPLLDEDLDINAYHTAQLYLYSDPSDNATYCFDMLDIIDLLNKQVNPFNEKRIPYEELNNMKIWLDNYPIDAITNIDAIKELYKYPFNVLSNSSNVQMKSPPVFSSSASTSSNSTPTKNSNVPIKKRTTIKQWGTTTSNTDLNKSKQSENKQIAYQKARDTEKRRAFAMAQREFGREIDEQDNKLPGGGASQYEVQNQTWSRHFPTQALRGIMRIKHNNIQLANKNTWRNMTREELIENIKHNQIELNNYFSKIRENGNYTAEQLNAFLNSRDHIEATYMDLLEQDRVQQMQKFKRESVCSTGTNPEYNITSDDGCPIYTEPNSEGCCVSNEEFNNTVAYEIKQIKEIKEIAHVETVEQFKRDAQILGLSQSQIAMDIDELNNSTQALHSQILDIVNTDQPLYRFISLFLGAIVDRFKFLFGELWEFIKILIGMLKQENPNIEKDLQEQENDPLNYTTVSDVINKGLEYLKNVGGYLYEKVKDSIKYITPALMRFFIFMGNKMVTLINTIINNPKLVQAWLMILIIVRRHLCKLFNQYMENVLIIPNKGTMDKMWGAILFAGTWMKNLSKFINTGSIYRVLKEYKSVIINSITTSIASTGIGIPIAGFVNFFANISFSLFEQAVEEGMQIMMQQIQLQRTYDLFVDAFDFKDCFKPVILELDEAKALYGSEVAMRIFNDQQETIKYLEKNEQKSEEQIEELNKREEIFWDKTKIARQNQIKEQQDKVNKRFGKQFGNGEIRSKNTGRKT